MACAARMGALLGTRDEESIDRLSSFGEAIGIAFQIRDDVLSVWASTAKSGKTAAGDVYRRKKSLPILHALESADAPALQFLRTVYSQESALTSEQVKEVLAIFERTHTKAYCYEFLARQCRLAHAVLAGVPRNNNLVAERALNDLKQLVLFVEDTIRA